MHVNWAGGLFPLITLAALVVIGVVVGPRAGAARGRVWLGLGLLIVQAVLGLGWQLVFPLLFTGEGIGLYSALSAVQGIVSIALFVGGVAALASAAAMGRGPGGALDASRPGAVPTGYPVPGRPDGYQGTGYPPPGSPPPQQPGGNPYV